MHNPPSPELTAGTDRTIEAERLRKRTRGLLDVLASDAAILASLALQLGCPLETITHALKRDARGEASSPIGAALDRIDP